MDLKLKLNSKNIARIAYLALLAACLISVYGLFKFGRQYVYYAYYPEKDIEFSRTTANSPVDINMSRFNEILATQKTKSVSTDLNGVRDVFD